MKKYIKQIDSTDFVYPNNNISEYGTTIIHDINNNSVTGNISGFTCTYQAADVCTFEYDWEWFSNGAEPFIEDGGEGVFLSAHIMPAGTSYYKAWKTFDYIKYPYTGQTSQWGHNEVDIYPADVNMTNLQNGIYYFEFRFIGHRSTFAVQHSFEVTGITAPDVFTLVSATPAGNNINYVWTGTSVDATAVTCSYSRDQITWTNSTSSPVSHRLIPINEPTGTYYFRLTQYFTYGGSENSNVLTYTYPNPVITGVTTVGGDIFNIMINPATITNCDGIVPMWSFNGVTFYDYMNLGFNCDEVQLIDLDGTMGARYFKVRQICLPTGTKYSNVFDILA